MTRPEEAIAIHETKYFHSSTFTELDDGKILHAANTTFTTSDDGGVTWSDEFNRTDIQGNPVGGGGTSLVRLSGKGIGLAAMQTFGDSPRDRGVAFWRSENQGETWEAPVRVTTPGVATHLYQDAITRTTSGRIVIPVYISMGQSSGFNDLKSPASGKLVNGQWVSTAGHFFDPHFSSVYLAFSDDDGRSWQRNKDGELMILQDPSAIFSYANEPTVTEVSPGKLLVMMRTGLGRIFQAWSYDNGETWTRPQPTSLSSSTAPAQIGTLPNGHLLVVWNQESEEEIKRGFNRTRLSSAVSRNGGSVWEFYQNIESIHESTRVEPGPIRPTRPEESHYKPGTPAPERDQDHVLTANFHGRWSYPSMFIMEDRVLVAHTYSVYEEHPTKAQLILDKTTVNQKLKVLPLSWFYGGKEPADNPFLPRAHDPAMP